MRRCCLIHLKNSSTCQRQRYSSVMVNAGKTKLLVRKISVLVVLRVLEADAAQWRLEIARGELAGEDNRLIADEPGTAIDAVRISALRLGVGLGARDEEAAGLVKAVQASEIEEAAIHDVEGTWLRNQVIEDVDLVQFAATDVNEGGDVAVQIEQGVQPDGRLGLLERRPRKHRQGQVDGGGVEGVDGVLQIDPERLVHIQSPGDADQALGKVGVDAPVAHRVGIGQGVARHRRAQAQMVELGALGAETGFDVAQTLAIGELRESHTQELVQTGERLDFVFASVPTYASAKRGQRKVLHQLCEHQLALVHRSPPRSHASQSRRSRIRSSNRDQEKSLITLF